jgi:hypothetical protein
MRKTIVAIALAVATTIAAPQLAVAAPPKDVVSGKATSVTPNFFDMRVNAQSGPLGESPKGSFAIDFDPAVAPDLKVDVSCMIVSGRNATIGGLDQTGREIFLQVQDNVDSDDLVGISYAADGDPAPGQDRCAEMLGLLVPSLPATGNLQVLDASPGQ